jgi:hypothetical protein
VDDFITECTFEEADFASDMIAILPARQEFNRLFMGRGRVGIGAELAHSGEPRSYRQPTVRATL